MTSVDAVGDLPLYPPPGLRNRVLDVDALTTRQARADRILAAEGAGHLVHDLPVRADGRAAGLESRPWRVDPIPLVLDAGTFQWLSLAVSERMEALEAVAADLYGERRLVQDRVVPPEVLASTDRYRINAIGSSPRRWISTYAVDVILDADGMWRLVQDCIDAPAGLGYALLDRSVMSRVLPEETSRPEVVSIARFAERLRQALAATSAVESPRTVLFSGGLDHPSYVDHSYLAVALGINLVEGADLVVRQRRVWLRTLDGLEPVDVLYRRLEDLFIDPLANASRGSIGVPGLLLAERAGGVSLANAHGVGVLEEPELRPYLADAIAHLRPMTQVLPELAGDAAAFAPVPVANPMKGPVPGGGLATAAAAIRLFAVFDGVHVHVLPGGTGRVLAAGDAPASPTACVAKDVWVLGWTPPHVVTPPRLPQVDFGRSVPTRAADALYWANRAAERAEAMARTMRIVAARVEQDPGLVALDGGRWCRRMVSAARAIRRAGVVAAGDDASLDALNDELVAVGETLSAHIALLLTEVTTVREFLSVTTGRVLAHLAELRVAMSEPSIAVDELDAVLADFAALAGLWQESTVRGPAWRIGDTGRRLERCAVMLDLIDGALGRMGDREVGGPVDRRDGGRVDGRDGGRVDGRDGGRVDDRDGGRVDDMVTSATIEVVLAANDSLVAYRRRHRSDVDVDLALRLLVNDESNPRSLAASIDRLGRHAADGEPALGDPFLADARHALTLPTAEMVPALRDVIDEAGRRIVNRWFSTPVNPIPLTSFEVGHSPVDGVI